jgi:hypothetical protein
MDAALGLLMKYAYVLLVGLLVALAAALLS